MFCNHCGKPLDADSQFCSGCGNRVQQAPAAPNPYAPNPYAPPVQQSYPQSESPYMPPAQQPYSQPEAPYMPPVQQPYIPPQQPQYAPTQWGYAQPAAETQWQEAAPVPKKPVNKKKLIIGIGIGVLVAALITVALLYFFVWNTPQGKVESAASTSVDELRELLGEGEEFVDMVENLCEMYNDGEMHVDLTVDGVDISLDVDTDSEFIGGALDMMGMEFMFSATSEELILSLPDILDEAYSIPLKDFGKELCNSPLAEEMPEEAIDMLEDFSLDIFSASMEEFKKTEEYERFAEIITPVEVENQIPNASSDLTVYCVSVEAKDFMELYFDYMEYVITPIFGEYGQMFTAQLADAKEEVLEEVEDVTITVLTGTNSDGCMVALHILANEDGEEESVSILLNGKNNPWEEIGFYTNERLDGTMRIVREGDGFAVYADEECILRGDGDSLTFAPDSYDEFTLYYGAEDDGCQFSAYVDGVDISVNMSPDADTSAIARNATSIFSLSERELEALIEQLSYYFG